ncbi:hypothetical protein H0H87_002676, partial [Tephrocybe sp. NHM501043]
MPPPFVSVPTEPAPGNAIHYPVSEILFMMHRNALVLAGSDFPQIRPWTDLQSPYGCPRSFIYYPVFIVANYEVCADNILAAIRVSPGSLSLVSLPSLPYSG